jgi:hypothetical protein
VTVPANSLKAAQLARHTGEGNACWMGFGPISVGLWRMAGALEVGDHERAVAIAEGLRPEMHPNLPRRAVYWVGYGRALAGMRGRHDAAVVALRRAEVISPVHLHRSPFARDTLATLVARSRRDAVGRELRGMACRGSPAGAPLLRRNTCCGRSSTPVDCDRRAGDGAGQRQAWPAGCGRCGWASGLAPPSSHLALPPPALSLCRHSFPCIVWFQISGALLKHPTERGRHRLAEALS